MKKFTVAISAGSTILHSMMKKQTYIAEVIDRNGERTIRVEAENLEEAYAMVDWMDANLEVLDLYLESEAYTG